MSFRVYLHNLPPRKLALATEDHVLVFRHDHVATGQSFNISTASLNPGLNVSGGNRPSPPPRCMVEFTKKSSLDLAQYHFMDYAQGTLGLITLNNDVFLCVITVAHQVAVLRPGETVQKIHSVQFCTSLDREWAIALTSRFSLPQSNGV